jgi:tRNA1(Val) A37 N6-methylase TrmN6
LSARARAIFGDLRTETPKLEAGAFDLVTGTPPYLPLGTATPSPDGQRAAARIELRGGIEAYLAAAAHAVSPTGSVVVCADGRTPERTRDAARAAGLVVVGVLHVLARASNTTPLFTVWTLAPGRSRADTETVDTHALRDDEGQPAPFAHEIVHFFGLDRGA